MRALGGLEPVAGHRAGAVEHDDRGVLGAHGGRIVDGGRGLQVEHDGDGVGGLDGDEVHIKMCGDVHGASVLQVWQLVGAGPPGWVEQGA